MIYDFHPGQEKRVGRHCREIKQKSLEKKLDLFDLFGSFQNSIYVSKIFQAPSIFLVDFSHAVPVSMLGLRGFGRRALGDTPGGGERHVVDSETLWWLLNIWQCVKTMYPW